MRLDDSARPSSTTEYFTGLARGYDAHRPRYPLAATQAILGDLDAKPTVVDVGCGTGISTRSLAQAAPAGARVIGLDPNSDMLKTARGVTAHTHAQQGSPSAEYRGWGPQMIDYRTGAAESTGLDDGVADVVVCAQAFHWFDPPKALKEFQRILKPHGRLALMWNVKDGRNAFSAGFCDVTERAMADAASRGLVVPPERGADAGVPIRDDLRMGSPAIGGYFTNIRQLMFDNPQQLNLDGVLGRARSASYFPKLGPLREALESELRRLFEKHQRDGTVTLWHRTELTLADRAE